MHHTINDSEVFIIWCGYYRECGTR